ncbi:hypothetical protein Tco_1264042 [Tanacetum coccineum]
MYYPRFTKVIIHYFLTQDKTLSWRNKIGMHTSRDDYLINTLRLVSAKEETQIYGAILPEYLTSPEMKETQAYKTYLGFATGATPPKKARKFKKLASPKLTTIPVSTEAPTGKSKRVKRPAKKSTKTPARGVVIRETPKMPLTKKKEKVDVTLGKGIELLSQVALTEDAQFEEGNDEDDSNNKQDSSGEDSDQENDSDDVKTQSDNENESDSEHETDECESGSKSDNEEYEEDEDDEEEVKDEFVKTLSNDFDDKDEGDEDEEMDYTTSQLYDDVDIRLNEPVDTDKGFVQEEGTVATMTNVQQRNENPDILQVIEDAHVTLSTVSQKTEVPVTSSSHSSDLASKFLNFSDIPHTDAEIVSPMDVHVHHEVPSQQTPTLLAVPVLVISDTSPVFSTSSHNHYHPSLLHHNYQHPHPPTTEATNPPSTLSDFALIFQFNNRVTTLEKEVVELKRIHSILK